MKSLRIIVFLLFLAGLVSFSSCSSEQVEGQETDQPAQTENSPETVSGNGELEVHNEVKLSFEISGILGEIYFEEGDRVSQGDILAKLNTDSLDLALNEAQAAYNETQAAYYQSQITVNQNETAMDAANVSVAQAEVNLKTAEHALEQTQNDFDLIDINAARAAVETAERNWEDAIFKLGKYDPGTPGWDEYQKAVLQAEARLNTARDTLDAMLFGFDTQEIAIKKLSVEVAKQSLENATQSQARAQLSLELARKTMGLTEQSVTLARQSLEIARNQLAKAVLVAPFDGAIATVTLKKGSLVSPSTYVIRLIDPNSMEVSVELDEIDVPLVKIGQRATITLDSYPEVPFSGKVRYISLVPAERTGINMYIVKIELDPIEANYEPRVGMSATADIIVSE